MSDGLVGRRVVITRSRCQAASFSALLSERGATPLIFPTIKTIAVDSDAVQEALGRLTTYDWVVLSSRNAVDYFLERVPRGAPLPALAVIGTASQLALHGHGFRADFIPSDFTAHSLAEEIGVSEGQTVLIPRSRIGRDELVDGLKRRGAIVDDVAIYDTVRDLPVQAECDAVVERTDAITFASPSSVTNFVRLLTDSRPDLNCAGLQDVVSSSVIACIGPTTAARALALGLSVDVVANPHTVDALVEALQTHFTRG